MNADRHMNEDTGGRGNGQVRHAMRWCTELRLSGVGEGPEEALYSLQEAVEALMARCESAGTLDQVMLEAGFLHRDGAWMCL
ncbi:MAG: hypothetical protein ACOC6A_02780 [Chloroflexota bacterium]